MENLSWLNCLKNNELELGNSSRELCGTKVCELTEIMKESKNQELSACNDSRCHRLCPKRMVCLFLKQEK